MGKNEPKTITGLISEIITNLDKSFRVMAPGFIILIFIF